MEFKKIVDVNFGKNVKVYDFVNLYGCKIGDDSMIGTFVEIQKNVVIGKNCRIQSHTFICEGVEIDDDVFVGHGVIFINDKKPRVNSPWTVEKVKIKKGASIGSGAIIMCGVTVGENALVGAGAVVTTDVPANSTVVGVPARVIRHED